MNFLNFRILLVISLFILSLNLTAQPPWYDGPWKPGDGKPPWAGGPCKGKGKGKGKGNPHCVPIDGGLGFLLIAGAAYGAYEYNRMKKREINKV